MGGGGFIIAYPGGTYVLCYESTVGLHSRRGILGDVERSLVPCVFGDVV